MEIGAENKRNIKTIFFPDWIALLPNYRQIRLDYTSRKTLNLINKQLSDYSNKEIPYSYVSSKITKILHLSKIFKEILTRISPNAVFIVCYHDENTAAVILASYELNIPTIEIQHGHQGIYNSLYCRWTKIPKDGYSLLPKYCWMWGEKSKDNMLAARNYNQSNPIPIVGGNRWLYKNILQKDQSAKENFIHDLKKCKVVTIATQPFPNIDTIIPDFVYDVINESPSDIKWLVKLHPHQLNQIDEITKLISQKIKNRNILVREILDYALYDILDITNFLITQWSTVIYESQSFNNIPVIVSKTGKELFSQNIDDGYFLYADDRLSLIRIIETQHKLPKDPRPFIKHDDHTAHLAMDQFVKFTIKNSHLS